MRYVRSAGGAHDTVYEARRAISIASPEMRPRDILCLEAKWHQAQSKAGDIRHGSRGILPTLSLYMLAAGKLKRK